MHILLTRPIEDCSDLIFRFKQLGHLVSHLPLLNIKKISYDSREIINCKEIKCFCVGSVTEKKAKSVGFQNIISAEGNVNNLKELILKNFSSSDGNLVYVSGEIISSDLDEQLINDGYSIKRVINYKTDHNRFFGNDFTEKLKINMPEVVYIYSQNSALSFLNFIKNENLESFWKNTNLMCLGEKTSSILNEIKWKKIFLFNTGEEEYLLYKI